MIDRSIWYAKAFNIQLVKYQMCVRGLCVKQPNTFDDTSTRKGRRPSVINNKINKFWTNKIYGNREKPFDHLQLDKCFCFPIRHWNPNRSYVSYIVDDVPIIWINIRLSSKIKRKENRELQSCCSITLVFYIYWIFPFVSYLVKSIPVQQSSQNKTTINRK